MPSPQTSNLPPPTRLCPHFLLHRFVRWQLRREWLVLASRWWRQQGDDREKERLNFSPLAKPILNWWKVRWTLNTFSASSRRDGGLNIPLSPMMGFHWKIRQQLKICCYQSKCGIHSSEGFTHPLLANTKGLWRWKTSDCLTTIYVGPTWNIKSERNWMYEWITTSISLMPRLLFAHRGVK